MQRVEPPTGPCQDVAIDVLGPLRSGENLLIVVDNYSRSFEVVIMHSTTSHKMTEALTPIFVHHGYLCNLTFDKNRIEHKKSPPLWPQAKAEVERQN